MGTVAGGVTFCAACGTPLEPGAVFCGTCGARVAPAGPTTTPAPDPGWSLGADVDDAVAPVWRRLVALLVDQLLAVVVGAAGLLAVLPAVRDDGSAGALLVPGLLLLLLGAGQWLGEAFGGRTVGGALLGTRTLSVRTGRPAGLWAVLVRSVVQALGGLVGGIGVYVVAGSGAWDEGPEQRGWHDKAAGTLVLRARPVGAGVPGAGGTGAGTADAPVAAVPAAAPAPRPGPTSGPPPAAAPAPVRDVPDDLPDATVPGLGELEHTHVGRWAAGPEAAGPATALVLVVDTGDRVAVTGPGLIGRRPVPGDETWTHLVTIDDPAQSVSSTHLAFWPADGGLDVLDRGSTNGTVLVDPAGKPWSLAPGAPARVAAGWTLVLGNRRVRVDPA